MSLPTFDFYRSISKKQVVAVTGLLLVLFVIAHLAGNLLIYAGPKAFNGYSEKLESLGVLKTIVEWVLFLIFVVHIDFTARLVFENIRARGITRYKVDNSRGPRSLATRLMPYSGTYLIIYLIWHIFDFTLNSHTGSLTYINGESYGLYGLVINAFKNQTHVYLYVLAMCFLGLHLAHGVQSIIQTFGFNDERFTPQIRKFSKLFALAIVILYSSIPLFVFYILKV